MAYLIDTSVLARLANTADPFFVIAANAIVKLHRRGESLQITAQNLIEFRNMATRLTALNGLGLAVAAAEAKVAAFEAAFAFVAETPDIFPAWKSLVGALGVIGKRVHDARLVAICQVHRLSHLLTFNTAHFIPLASHAASVTIVDPASV